MSGVIDKLCATGKQTEKHRSLFEMNRFDENSKIKTFNCLPSGCIVAECAGYCSANDRKFQFAICTYPGQYCWSVAVPDTWCQTIQSEEAMRRLATANRHQCIELFVVHVLPDGTQCKLGTRHTRWHLKSESLPLIPQCGVHRFFYWHSNETWVWLAKFSFIQCSSETPNLRYRDCFILSIVVGLLSAT